MTASGALVPRSSWAPTARTLAGHVPPDTLPDFDYLTQLAAPGLRERLLRESGLE